MSPDNVDVRECRDLRAICRMEIDSKISKLHEKINKAISDVEHRVTKVRDDTNADIKRLYLVILAGALAIIANLMGTLFIILYK